MCPSSQSVSRPRLANVNQGFSDFCTEGSYTSSKRLNLKLSSKKILSQKNHCIRKVHSRGTRF